MQGLKLQEGCVSLPILENSETNRKATKRCSVLPQFFFTFSICLLSLIGGASLTWPASALIELQSPNATLVLTQEEGSWVVSILPIGGMPGPFLIGSLANQLGRRVTGLLVVVPLLLHWILIIFAEDVWHFYVARFFGGIGVSGLAIIVPMYIIEIAERDKRALLGAFYPLSLTLGMLQSMAFSIFLNYKGLSIVSAGICVLFLVIFYFAPETPAYYVINKKMNSARKSIKILYGEGKADRILEETVYMITSASRIKNISFRELVKDEAFIKGVISAIGVVISCELCGMSFVTTYMERILMDTGSSVNPKLAANIILWAQFLAAVLQLFVIERFPRKVLLLQNSILSCLTLGILGLQSLLHWKLGWLPMVCLLIFCVSYVWGFFAITATITGEVITPQAKEYVYTGASILYSISNFTGTKTFPSLVLSIGIGWAFMVFAGLMLLSTLHIIFIVPEGTKGKTSKEIQDELYGRSKRRNIK